MGMLVTMSSVVSSLKTSLIGWNSKSVWAVVAFGYVQILNDPSTFDEQTWQQADE
jgi:hypothetical protein